MAKRDIIVVGASAGGVKALKELVGSLPEDIDASIFVVLHIPSHSESNLPEILNKDVRLLEGRFIRFRCHTGHAYTASTLLASITETVEETLWQSMRGFEESTMLLKNIAKHFKELKDAKSAALFSRKAEETAKRAQVIHDSIFTQEIYSEDLRFKSHKKDS